jgi:hypothetical protein
VTSERGFVNVLKQVARGHPPHSVRCVVAVVVAIITHAIYLLSQHGQLLIDKHEEGDLSACVAAFD